MFIKDTVRVSGAQFNPKVFFNAPGNHAVSVGSTYSAQSQKVYNLIQSMVFLLFFFSLCFVCLNFICLLIGGYSWRMKREWWSNCRRSLIISYSNPKRQTNEFLKRKTGILKILNKEKIYFCLLPWIFHFSVCVCVRFSFRDLLWSSLILLIINIWVRLPLLANFK